MMEEVAVMMAYDSHVMEQMSEEEILACLVAETEPKFTDPTMETKQGESRLQIMEDEEDPLDKCMRENRRLEQDILCLEQENDNLAQRLIIGKVALRNALDEAEDRVDELTKDLLQTRHQLLSTEEEKTLQEQEAAMLKEMVRNELKKAEQKIRRSSGIITDYKQICSQLTNRLEWQQAAHREEFDSLASAVKACTRCRHIVESDKASAEEGHEMTQPDREEDSERPKKAEQRRDDREKDSLKAQVRELEKDLVQTKLHMVEAKCRIQELEHQRGILANDLQVANNSWISKAFTSLRPSSSGGGLQALSIPGDGAPTVGLNRHGGALSRWSAKKLSWPHRMKRKTSEDCEHADNVKPEKTEAQPDLF